MGTLPRRMEIEPCLRPLESAEFTLKERRSEFIASLFPAETADEAREFLEEIRRRNLSATHNCPAWRVNYPCGDEFSSDDGEPAGTAGRPILGVLQSAGMWNAVIVVTRYFGGVKLGVRGLIDAYSAAAQGVLTRAKTQKSLAYRAVTLRCGYSKVADARHLIKIAGVPERRTRLEWGTEIVITLNVAPKTEARVRESLDSYEARQIFSSPPEWSENFVLAEAEEE